MAITGLGVVSPAGIGVNEFFEGLLTCRSGVTHLSVHHAERLRIRIGAPIAQFKFDVPKDRSGQLDRYAQLGLAAVREAWQQAGAAGSFEPDRGGVYFGTSLGGAATLETAYIDLFEKNASRVHPKIGRAHV